MMNSLLLPHRYKKIGWILLIPAAVLGILGVIMDIESVLPIQSKVLALVGDEGLLKQKYFSVISTNITLTLIGMLFIIGALLVGFSKEKQEDEYIAEVRLNALLWAVLVNYSLLLVAFAFVYGLSFLTVMIYNMFTVLILFIARFHIALYRNAKNISDEKHD